MLLLSQLQSMVSLTMMLPTHQNSQHPPSHQLLAVLEEDLSSPSLELALTQMLTQQLPCALMSVLYNLLLTLKSPVLLQPMQDQELNLVMLLFHKFQEPSVSLP